MKNRGRAQYRFKDNPMERRFAELWERMNMDYSGRVNGRGVLDYLMAEDPNMPAGEVTDRDKEVAATVIQWLGSPVGKSFLAEVWDGTVRLGR